MLQSSFDLHSKLHAKNVFWAPQRGFGDTFLYTKTGQKNHSFRLTIQEPIFSVSNTEFEGGDDGYGHGDHTFLVKQAQPSHRAADQLIKPFLTP